MISPQVVSGNGARRLATALVALLSLLPFWLVEILPLSDIISHLARAVVLARPAAYAHVYEPAWGPYPNLAFDLFAVPLVAVLPPMLVAKLFLSLIVGIWAWAAHRLSVALLGRPSYRAALATGLVLSQPLLLGYVSFAFGTAVALHALATALGERPRTGRRVAIVALLSLVCAVSHAAAIVGLAVALFAAGVTRAWLARSRHRDAAWELVAHGASALPGAVYFANWLLAHADRSADQAMSHPLVSLKALIMVSLGTFARRWDVVVFPLVLVLGALALYRAGLRLRPVVLAAALALAACVFVAPADFAGSYEANGRYALLAWALGIFAFDIGATLPRRTRVAGLLLLGLAGARALLLGYGIWQHGRIAIRQEQVLAELPEGARLANVSYFEALTRAGRLDELSLLHLPALAVIDKRADLPTLYAIRGVQPIRHVRPGYDVHRFKADQVPDLELLRSDFDAVWLCRAPEPVRQELVHGFVVAGEAEGCALLLRRER